MGELENESADNDGLRRIREQYQEECRDLEQDRARVKMETERVYSIFMECLGPSSDFDMASLSAQLDAEHLQFSKSDLTQEKIGDALALQLITLIMRGRRLDARFERMNAEIETRQTCHNCGGLGKVEKERHYERDGGRATPVQKVDDCTLCGGKGRVWLGSSGLQKRR